ncbi:flagellar hook-length control protein FliK [Vibrio rhizosphaerae]|uniref:Flagellar hook-length control protein FliK n=1 Tax=Vibrio rhizosphaerae TaxID=398736 RepID=A0ABU4IVR9_9VIBR|nr:flagellar hook-length control protein FliK [Vibrio rhizosphaerae]MDW6093502.1 flagellar hook-length control protein FliK [Vibrio rhizosphaerae]
MNINLTPTSGTQKAQSHHKAASDDAIVSDAAESSQESGGFFAKLAALFKGEDSVAEKPSLKGEEAKSIAATSTVAGDMSADALLSDSTVSDKDISGKVLAGEELSQAELAETDATETLSPKNGAENVDDVDSAQIAAAKISDKSLQHQGDTTEVNGTPSDVRQQTVATPSSSQPAIESGDPSAQKEAALRTMGEGEAVLNRLKGAEQQLVSQNGNKLPAPDIIDTAKQAHAVNPEQQLKGIDPATLQDTTVPADLSLSDPEAESSSLHRKGKELGEHELTGEKALAADINQLADVVTQSNGRVASSVIASGKTQDVGHQDTGQKNTTVSSVQVPAGMNLRDVANQEAVSQGTMQNIALTDDDVQASVSAGAEGNPEKAVLSQKLLQSLNQELPSRVDPRHHTQAIQQQSQTVPVPVNPLTQAIQSDGAMQSLAHLAADSVASQAALQTLSASAVGREQWIRQRLAGFGDGKSRPDGMMDDGTGKESHFAHQMSALTGQQTSGVQNHIRADVAQNPTSVYLAKDAMAADQLSERVQMMMSKNLKNIDIRLDPPELGRMHIRMNMSGDATTVHFTVATPQAREALEHSMPRLRDMLSQQGVQLGETSVQHQSSGQQQHGYAASGQGQSSGRGSVSGQDSVFHDDNPDTGVKLDVDVRSKRDGISYYA